MSLKDSIDEACKRLHYPVHYFLANVNSFAICCRPPVRRLSVTLVLPIPSRLKFSAIFLRHFPFGTLAISSIILILERPIITPNHTILANTNSRSLCCRPFVCLSSVKFMRPILSWWKFSAPWPSLDIQGKFYGDRPRRIPPSGELNARGVAKYSDFGAIEVHISEMAQDGR